MPTCSVDQSDVVRQYFAAFPALDNRRDTPLQYYQPAPQWCRKPNTQNKAMLGPELKDWSTKQKKFNKERRNLHAPRKSRKSLFHKPSAKGEQLPEWMTNEDVWDIETQDSVKEFLRAIAMDEGYVTCENTVVDEMKHITGGYRQNEDAVPDLDDSFDFNGTWYVAEDPKPKRARSPSEIEMYTQFQAKFNSSIEALWSNDQSTPDDEYQDLPIDFQDLLSSPSDNLHLEQPVTFKKTCDPIDAKWPHENAFLSKLIVPTIPTKDEYLFSLFRPLTITDLMEPDFPEAEADAAAINHSRGSGFVPVGSRGRARAERMPYTSAIEAKSLSERLAAPPDAEDLLTSSRTHFKPIGREGRPEPAARYADGATFEVNSDLDPPKYVATASGHVTIEGSKQLYLGYTPPEDATVRLYFPLRKVDAAVQTDGPSSPLAAPCAGCGRAPKKMRGEADGGACLSCEEGGGAADAPAPAAEEEKVEAVGGSPERKRRHSTAMRCAARSLCTHPHAPFLQCCVLAADRPLTR